MWVWVYTQAVGWIGSTSSFLSLVATELNALFWSVRENVTIIFLLFRLRRLKVFNECFSESIENAYKKQSFLNQNHSLKFVCFFQKKTNFLSRKTRYSKLLFASVDKISSNYLHQYSSYWRIISNFQPSATTAYPSSTPR